MPKTLRARTDKHAPLAEIHSAKEPAATKTDPYFSRAVGKALEALNALGEAGEPRSLGELTAALKLTKASTFRILHTLQILGYINKAPDGRYQPAGARQGQVSARLVNQLMQAGIEPLQALAMKFRETVSMAALLDNHIEVVTVLESPQLMRMGNTVGRILPPHASSLGKAITAFQGQELRHKLLRSYGTPVLTSQTIGDELALRQEFARIQQQGHAEDREESTLGGCCFAAPILRSNGFAAGAVSLSMPKMRLNSQDHEREIVAAVRRTARSIADALVGI